MAEPDEPFGVEHLPAEPGFRWVEVYDPRLTNRIAWMKVAADAPDPEPEQEFPEGIARTRRLVADLLRRPRC